MQFTLTVFAVAMAKPAAEADAEADADADHVIEAKDINFLREERGEKTSVVT